jgi:hypothetical protein
MYVEAICPLCLASHVLPADMRGTRYRCEECEEVFIVNRRSKKTTKSPPRLRKVRPADDPDKAAAAAPDVLPVVSDAPSRRRRGEDDDDKPRKRSARRPRRRRWLAISLASLLVVLIWASGIGIWWTKWGRDGNDTGQANNHTPEGPRVAAGKPIEQPDPNKDPDPPKKDPPKKDPPKNEGPPAWKVKADPPAAPVRLPADFKKEIGARAINTEVVFPTSTGSPFVAVGDNFDDKDERQVWNLQTDAAAGKLVGRKYSAERPVLSPDGAHLAVLPFGEKEIVDVVDMKTGKKLVRIDTGLPTEVVDFAGPGKLLVAGKRGATLHLRIWDVTTGKREHDTGKREHDFDGPTLGKPPTLTRDMLAISPGGAWLAVVTPDNLSLWDLKMGSAAGERALPWNSANWLLPCRGLSFSPDGSELAALFQVNGQSRLVCWDVVRGEAGFDVTFPALRLGVGAEMAYKGHVLGWVGDRRGWLVYGQMFIDRKADKVGPAPSGLLAADQPFRRMVGPDHVATLPGGLGGKKTLTISPFDPDKLK